MRAKNKSRGRPRVDSEEVRARMPRDLVDAIDAFIDDFADIKSRPEAIRYLLRDHLTGLGYIELPPEKRSGSRD